MIFLVNILNRTKEFYHLASAYYLDNFSIYSRSIERMNTGLREGKTKFIHLHENLEFTFKGTFQNRVISFKLQSPSLSTFRLILEENIQEINDNKIRKVKSTSTSKNFKQIYFQHHYSPTISNLTIEQLIANTNRLYNELKDLPLKFTQMLVEKQTETRVYCHSGNNEMYVEKKNMLFYLITLLISTNSEVIHVPFFEVVDKNINEKHWMEKLLKKIQRYEGLNHQNEMVETIVPTKVILGGHFLTKLLKYTYPKIARILINRNVKLSEEINIESNPHIDYGNTGTFFTDDGELTSLYTLVRNGEILGETDKIEDRLVFEKVLRRPGNLVIYSNKRRTIEKDEPYIMLIDLSDVNMKIDESLNFYIKSHASIMLNNKYIKSIPNLTIEGNLIKLLQVVKGVDLELSYNFPDQFSIFAPSLLINTDFEFSKKGLRIV